MKKFILLVIACIPVIFSSAQTCVGTFAIRVIDEKTKKAVTDKLDRDIWYLFTKPQDEFYDDAEAVQPLDSMIKTNSFTVKHNEHGYNYFPAGEDKSLNMFAALCGLYLIQTEFIRKGDTMRLALYNVPAHQSFQIDTLTFKKGNYLIDFQGSRLLSEMEFADNEGYFRVPPGVMQPAFPKKKQD